MVYYKRSHDIITNNIRFCDKKSYIWVCLWYDMSINVPKTYTIKFASKEDKTKAFDFLMNSNISFKGINIDTIVVQKSTRDALVGKNIRFD